MNCDWININDCLPDEYELVLISCIDEYDLKLRYTPTIGFIKHNIWHTREGDIENNSLLFDYFKEHHLIPTHWAELPDAPT